RRRRRPERLIGAALHDLVQIGIVDPYALAVTDQQLLIRLGDVPAEFAGTRDRELTACFLLGLSVPVGDRLREARTRGLGLANERAQTFHRRSLCRLGEDAKNEDEPAFAHAVHESQGPQPEATRATNSARRRALRRL